MPEAKYGLFQYGLATYAEEGPTSVPERSTIAQVTQIGVETTPGTAVAANKLLTSMAFVPKPEAEINRYRPEGLKWPTISAVGKEWTTGDISGIGNYTEIVYPLSSVINTAVITTPGGGTLSRQWQFISATTTEDTPKTFTIEHGSGARAEKYAYGIVTDLNINISRSGVEVGGSMMAQRLTDGITLTATPTTILQVPIVPNQVNVYADDTSGGLGTTKLLRAFMANFAITSRYGPVWPLDRTQTSFAAHVEIEPNARLEITVAADSVGMALLTFMRAGTTKYCRVEAIGAVIEAAITYSFIIDFAGKISGPPEYVNQDGVWGVKWNLDAYFDSAWGSGKAFEIRVINLLTTL